MIVIGKSDGTISFFGLNGSSMGKPYQFYSGFPFYGDDQRSRAISTICFSRDGNLMVSGGYDGFVRLWKFQAPDSMMDLEHAAKVHEELKKKYDLD